MQERVGKGGEMGCGLAHPSLHRVRIDLKHAGHRSDTQPFGHGGDRADHPLGRVRLAVKECTVRLQKVGLTHDALELSPGSTPWMAISADITVPNPAIISARFVGTVTMTGVDRSWASARGRTQRWGGQRGLVAGLLALLTGLVAGLLGHASKRLRDCGRSYGPLRERMLRCLALLPPPIGDHQLPE